MEYVVSSKNISMEAKRIEVIKNSLELKSVHNIQIFLDFTNFYWQFIQGFSRIAALFILMLKTIRSRDKLASSKNDGSKLASNRKNDSKLAFRKNDSNSEVDRFSVGKNDMEHIKKLGKLSKLRKLFKSGKSKSKKTSKSQNLARSGKKLLKSENLTNFNAMKAGPKVFNPRR